MASATYENIIREVEQLTEEEQRQLQHELTHITHADRSEHSPDLPTMPTVGAFAAALRARPPMRPETLDAMERAIEEAFEGIEPND